MNVRKRVLFPVLFGVASMLWIGCGGSRKTAYLQDQKGQATPPPAGDDGSDSADDLRASAEEAWQGREDLGKLKEAIALYEKIVAQEPSDQATLTRLSRAYYLLANGHFTDLEQQLAAFDKGAGYGEQAMALNAAFRKAVESGKSDTEALKLLEKEDVGGLYWAYGNLGKWSVAKGFTTVLKYKNKLKAFIDRVVELDEDYFHGAGHRGLGAYYAKAPSFAGGDLKKARHHFDRSLAIAPDYLGTKNLIAEYYYPKLQSEDPKAKEKCAAILGEILSADASALPDIVPEQKLEQAYAQRLLDGIDEKFAD